MPRVGRGGGGGRRSRDARWGGGGGSPHPLGPLPPRYQSRGLWGCAETAAPGGGSVSSPAAFHARRVGGGGGGEGGEGGRASVASAVGLSGRAAQ